MKKGGYHTAYPVPGKKMRIRRFKNRNSWYDFKRKSGKVRFWK